MQAQHLEVCKKSDYFGACKIGYLWVSNIAGF